MGSPVSIRRREVLPMTCTERRKTGRLPAPPEAACAPSCLFLRPPELDITNPGVLSCGPPSRPRWLVLTNHVHNLPQTSGLVKPLFSFSKKFFSAAFAGAEHLAPQASAEAFQPQRKQKQSQCRHRGLLSSPPCGRHPPPHVAPVHTACSGRAAASKYAVSTSSSSVSSSPILGIKTRSCRSRS